MDLSVQNRSQDNPVPRVLHVCRVGWLHERQGKKGVGTHAEWESSSFLHFHNNPDISDQDSEVQMLLSAELARGLGGLARLLAYCCRPLCCEDCATRSDGSGGRGARFCPFLLSLGFFLAWDPNPKAFMT